MRFKNKPYMKRWQTKTETKFLLFPLRLENETRWLEKATIEYECQQFVPFGDDRYYPRLGWFPIKFVD